MLSTVCPAAMSPEQRLGEVAAVLAAGVLRLRRDISPEAAESVPEPTFPILSESAAQGLEVPAKTVLTVRHGG